MDFPISIVGIGSISPLGSNWEVILSNYRSNRHFIVKEKIEDLEAYVSKIPRNSKENIENLKKIQKFKNLDDSVLYAIFTSRMALENAQWGSDRTFGINIGSSRGATTLFEKYHSAFLNNEHISALTSPTTTLGNISSWVAQDLLSKGPNISHSITCSTSMHAILNAIAWLKSGLCERFLVGGSEAPLTDFTIAQMKALKIYSNDDDEYPCRSLDLSQRWNSMVLGEGAAIVCIEKGIRENTLAIIEGFGFANEYIEHSASLSADGRCFQESMKMAIKDLQPTDIDIIISHSPGTIKGDGSEVNAIKKIFQKDLPSLTCNKWQIGHTLGASGILSIEMAIIMLQTQQFFSIPYLKNKPPKAINRIMVNSVGFGGNAVSILLKHPSC